MECELLRSPMISYRSLLYNTTVLYENTKIINSNLFAHFYPVSLPPGIKLLDKLRLLIITGVGGTCCHYNTEKTL